MELEGNNFEFILINQQRLWLHARLWTDIVYLWKIKRTWPLSEISWAVPWILKLRKSLIYELIKSTVSFSHVPGSIIGPNHFHSHPTHTSHTSWNFFAWFQINQHKDFAVAVMNLGSFLRWTFQWLDRINESQRIVHQFSMESYGILAMKWWWKL